MGKITMKDKMTKVLVLVLILTLSFYANTENSQNDYVAFKYISRMGHLICARKVHHCYMYNMTGQEQLDVRDPIKVFEIESKVINMLNNRTTYFKGASRDHYK